MIYCTAVSQRTNVCRIALYALFLVFAVTDCTPKKEGTTSQRIPQVADVAIDEPVLACTQAPIVERELFLPKTYSDKYADPNIKIVVKPSIKITTSAKPVNPFGIKNPENNNKRWEGSIRNGQEYAAFIAPEYAVRASTKILCTLQLEKKSYSLRSIFRKYVASDDIDEYLERLQKDTGISPDEKIMFFNSDGTVKDMELFEKLMLSIAHCETSNKDRITLKQIENGIQLYHRDFC
jgi:hypothetical protein